MLATFRAAFCVAFIGLLIGSMLGCGSNADKAPAVPKNGHFEGDGHDHSHEGHDHKEGEEHK